MGGFAEGQLVFAVLMDTTQPWAEIGEGGVKALDLAKNTGEVKKLAAGCSGGPVKKLTISGKEIDFIKVGGAKGFNYKKGNHGLAYRKTKSAFVVVCVECDNAPNIAGTAADKIVESVVGAGY